MYKVVLTQRAVKDLEKIDKETKDRIATKLKEYSANPLKYCRKLTDPKIRTRYIEKRTREFRYMRGSLGEQLLDLPPRNKPLPLGSG